MWSEPILYRSNLSIRVKSYDPFENYIYIDKFYKNIYKLCSKYLFRMFIVFYEYIFILFYVTKLRCCMPI